ERAPQSPAPIVFPDARGIRIATPDALGAFVQEYLSYLNGIMTRMENGLIAQSKTIADEYNKAMKTVEGVDRRVASQVSAAIDGNGKHRTSDAVIAALAESQKAISDELTMLQSRIVDIRRQLPTLFPDLRIKGTAMPSGDDTIDDPVDS